MSTITTSDVILALALTTGPAIRDEFESESQGYMQVANRLLSGDELTPCARKMCEFTRDTLLGRKPIQVGDSIASKSTIDRFVFEDKPFNFSEADKRTFASQLETKFLVRDMAPKRTAASA